MIWIYHTRIVQAKEIPNFRTARHIVTELSFPTGYNKRRAERQSYNLISKPFNAEPLTGRIAREIIQANDIAHNSSLRIDDLRKQRHVLQ